MTNDLLNKYIWLIDTIKRHGRISRSQINALWMESEVSGGAPLARRTFYHYRNAVEELFNINIECDPATYEYFIAQTDEISESVSNWLLNSAATTGLLSGARDVSDRVLLEDVPSAREHLAVVIEALRCSVAITFDYHPYTRSLPTTGIAFEPYFTKIFKQRWYVVGRNVRDDKIKTYALDRMSRVKQTSATFTMPEDFDPRHYFDHAFGIVVDSSETRRIVLRVSPTQAKYFRALPLHRSQSERVGDGYSEFEYVMRPTADLVSEILSYGPDVTVVEPPELKTMVRAKLSQALASYGK